MTQPTTPARPVAQDGAGAATGDATPPVLAPGYYRRPGSDRWWRDDELAVVWYDERWCIAPIVALAALETSHG